jgi:hypothetical protein
VIPDPREQPTLDATRVAALYGVSERAAYDGGRRWVETGGAEGIPAVKVGRSTRFLTAPILEQLGLAPAMEAGAP